MLPHQLYSAARSRGARNVPGGFQGLLPHQIINVPSNHPAPPPPQGHVQVQVQERNWIQEDETLILDIGTAQPRENVERDGGLSETLILKYLKTRDCGHEVNNDGEAKMCVVCQDDLCQENSRIGVLDCGHEYHASCIRQWLQQKNTCPLCKTIALRV
ncbi:UNVERIFIED_CONTAM: putative E3 ubiquitin-protein ligase RHG1A [Sesamum radiatum]|uniref:RING-type E3 ubiquitin transferase n=1 Tax=Sesamum radiatum TaxID=300843 RepID=A0AAW2PI73_SESRA